MRRLVPLLASLLILFGADEASACSFPIRHHSSEEIRGMAAESFASASLVIDGEVIQPMLIPYPNGTMPAAYIKVFHAWKGHIDYPDVPIVVAYHDSCDIALMVPHQKIRILLSGEKIFTASQFNNGYQAPYEEAAFKREVDRLIGSPRPTSFTDPGAEPEPTKK